jgi:hypothetical protein
MATDYTPCGARRNGTLFDHMCVKPDGHDGRTHECACSAVWATDPPKVKP